MGDLGEGGYEAWILLGETRNMDEREDAGMKALVEGVKRAERAGATGDGMLVGRSSCTNTLKSNDTISFSLLPFRSQTNPTTARHIRPFSVGFGLVSRLILFLPKRKPQSRSLPGIPMKLSPPPSLMWPAHSTKQERWTQTFKSLWVYYHTHRVTTSGQEIASKALYPFGQR